MDWLTDLFWHQGRFLGIEWHVWKVIGWLGNVTFFTRFLVQWYFTERHRRVVIPAAFWWLSLVGATLLFTYAIGYQHDSVFIFAYAFTWIPYLRNLVIHYRTHGAGGVCGSCGAELVSQSRFCHRCGVAVAASEVGGAMRGAC